MKIRMLIITVLAASFALAACEYNGGVEQGRAVAFEAGKNLTVVLDTSTVRGKPAYNGKIAIYKLPIDPVDMGPLPTVGGMLSVNVDKKTITVFDSATMGIKELPVDFTDVQKDIESTHPLVSGKTFPVIDKEKQTVTIYSRGLRSLLTFNPGAAMSMPANTWRAGDEMRIAMRNTDKSQALRIMNISKTNIFNR